jgi:hypothetical protein
MPAPMKPEHCCLRFARGSDEGRCIIGFCPDLYFGGRGHDDRDTMLPRRHPLQA